ncbi:hypothetical protein [Tardiphaga sp. 862_B3_N1_1]|uniref:hypothetical protein n=1 Tax=Tardiphaga sp. 862_B3_N1_1 TaxID=3240763 RepID=UPI003F8A8BFF
MTYKPQAGTLVYRAIKHLNGMGPDEKIANAVLADLLETDLGTLNTSLRYAEDRGAAKSEKIEGRIYWSRGVCFLDDLTKSGASQVKPKPPERIAAAMQPVARPPAPAPTPAPTPAPVPPALAPAQPVPEPAPAPVPAPVAPVPEPVEELPPAVQAAAEQLADEMGGVLQQIAENTKPVFGIFSNGNLSIQIPGQDLVILNDREALQLQKFMNRVIDTPQ